MSLRSLPARGAVAVLIAATALACSGAPPTDRVSEPGKETPSASARHSASARPGTEPRATATVPTGRPTAAGPPDLPSLPRGGRTIFPRYRVVAYYGGGAATLGVLGETPPTEAAARLARAARPFATPGRPVLPAFELIVATAQSRPGPDGDYSSNLDEATVSRYLAAARRMHGLLLLDIQPGRGDFLPKARHYERFLAQPDVGLALDSEWKMAAGEVPGETIGSGSAADVNEVSAWLAGIVARHRLPQKLFVLHQFVDSMLADRERIVARPGLATTVHLDGFGTPEGKLAKYQALHAEPPFFNGFKLFYDEDIRRLTPAATLRLRPSPDLISYQ